MLSPSYEMATLGKLGRTENEVAVHVLVREVYAMVEIPAPFRRLGAAAIQMPARYFTPSSSTSNISVAFGGMTPPAPRAP